MVKRQATITPRKTVKIHIKILTASNDPSLQQRFNAMNTIYNTAGIDVVHASSQTLNNAESLNDLDIGQDGADSDIPACKGIVTEDQRHLAEFRDNVPEGEIVVYICRSLTNGNDGCATHPEGIPMAVITANSPLYTMAHEVAHLLGRKGHPKKLDSKRLMNSLSLTDVENNPVPILTSNEIKTIRSTALLKKKKMSNA